MPPAHGDVEELAVAERVPEPAVALSAAVAEGCVLTSPTAKDAKDERELPSAPPPPPAAPSDAVWIEYTCGKSEIEWTGSSEIWQTLRDAFDPRRNLRDIFYRAQTGGAGRLDPLDGIRALAFLWVTADHAMEMAVKYSGSWQECVFLTPAEGYAFGQTWKTWTCTLTTEYAELGVTMFFVLSGFLIVYILFHMFERERQLSYCKFLVRRFFRIWPSLNAYWLLSIPCFLYLMPTDKHAPGYLKDAWVEPCYGYGWTNLVFVTNLSNCFGLKSCQEHLWTVSTEFQMYLITPLFVRVYLYSERLGYLSASALVLWTLTFGTVINWLIGPGDETLNCQLTNTNSPIYRIGEYACGMLCAMGYLSSTRGGGGGAWWALDGVRARWRERASRERFVFAVVLVFACAFVVWATVVSLTKAARDSVWYQTLFARSGGYMMQHLVFSSMIALVIRATLDPECGGALARVLGHPFWYPLAALSYTGYLFSYIPSGWAFFFVRDAAGCGLESYWCWWLYYLLNVPMVLVFALALSLGVERPFMRIGQALTRIAPKSTPPPPRAGSAATNEPAPPALGQAAADAADNVDGQAMSSYYGSLGNGDEVVVPDAGTDRPLRQPRALDRATAALGFAAVLGMTASIKFTNHASTVEASNSFARQHATAAWDSSCLGGNKSTTRFLTDNLNMLERFNVTEMLVENCSDAAVQISTSCVERCVDDCFDSALECTTATCSYDCVPMCVTAFRAETAPHHACLGDA